MRIEEFHIDGFGRFENLRVTGLGPGLSVVLGRNEAGKSTLLAFLRAVLFGLPNRKQAEHYPPLNGGRHGGRIVLVGGGNERIVVERHAGKGTGKFTATLSGGSGSGGSGSDGSGSDGSQLGEEQFRQRLGMVTGDVYEKVFAFGLGELQAFETLQTESIRDAIYSAGMGTGGQSPAQVVRQLNDCCERLFKPGGSNPEMNQILKRLLQRRQEIDGHAIDVEEHQRTQTDLKRAERESEELAETLHLSRERLARLHRLQQARDDWILLTETRRQLESLPRIDSFPAEGVSRLETLLHEQRSLRDRLREARDEKRDAGKELEEIQIDERLLSLSSDIRGLERKVDLFEQNRQHLTTTQTDRKLAEQQVQQSLRELGEEWNEETLRRFDLSLPAREELDEARRQCDVADSGVERQAGDVERREEELRERKESEETERDKFNQLAGPAGGLDIEGIRRLERTQSEYESARRDLPRVRQECTGNEQRLREILRAINPDWTEDRLDQFDDSLWAREELNAHRERLQDLRTRLTQLESRTDASDQSLRDEQAALDRDEAALEALPDVEETDQATLLDRKSALRGLRSLITQYAQSRSDLAHQEERKQDLEAQLARLQQEVEQADVGLPVWLAPGVAVLGLFGLLLLGLVRNDWIMGTILFLIAAIFAGLLFFLQRQSSGAPVSGTDQRAREREQLREQLAGIESALEEHRQREEHLRERITQQATGLGLGDVLNGNSHGDLVGTGVVDEQEERIEQQLALLSQRRPLEQRIDDRQRQVKRMQSALKETRQTQQELQQQLEEAQADWRNWLREAGLPETLSPDVAINVLSRLDSARELLRTVNDQRQRIRRMEQEIARFETSVQTVAEKSGIDELPDEPIAAVQTITDRLSEHEARQRDLQEARRRLKEAEQRTKQAEERLREIERLLESAREAQQQARQQWKELLRRRGLRETLTGAQAEQMLQGIERARDQLAQLDKLQSTERDLSGQVAAFIAEVERVASSVEGSRLSDESALTPDSTLNAEPSTLDAPRTSPEAVSSRVEDLVSALAQAQEADRLRKGLEEQIQSAKEQIERFEAQIAERQEEIDRLFEAAGTADEESFRQRASDYETYQRLSEELRAVETRLRQLAGSVEALPALERELEQSTPEAVQTEQQELHETITDLEQRREDSVRESEKLRLRLEQLENSDEISTLRMQQAADLAEFRSLAREWTVHRIAAHLIDRAREKYERERRPAVVKQAEQYFTRLTQGRYREVLIAGEGDPQVVTTDGTRKELRHLSRGTAEQLYLSLRFGYVEEFMRQASPLPLIFDDILVNFDPERAAAAAEAIGELSRNQQILLFTCHPATAERLRRVVGGAAVFELQNGQLTNPNLGGAE
jgi:uncharacterized protein YhaN